MPSAICSNLLPRYITWKTSLNEMRQAMVAYQESGSDADQRDFDTAHRCVEQAMHQYRSTAYPEFFKECVVGGKTHRLFADDAEVMEKIMEGFRDLDIQHDFIHSSQGRVLSFKENDLKLCLEENTNFAEDFLSYVVTLKDLRTLYVSAGIGEMPNTLPETIEEIKIISPYITVLPGYHLPRLTALDLAGMDISSIPQSILGSSLKNLLLPESIQTLPELSTTSLVYLRGIYCKNITQMPQLPPTIKILDFEESGITSLTNLPDGMEKVNLKYTPAAKDKNTKRYLKKYAERNPGTQIMY